MRLLRFVVAVAVGLVWAGRASAGAVAIVDVGVVDVAVGRVVPHQTVVVEREKIARVGGVGEVAVPEGAERIDGAGMFLMPGLFDCHAHLGGSAGTNVDPREFADGEVERKLAGFLACGVTTVRSLCDATGAVLELRDQVARGKVLGPRVLVAGPAVTSVGGHPVELFRYVPGLVAQTTRQVSTVEQVDRVVEELAKDKVDVIKAVYDGMPGQPKLTPELMQRIVEKAHERGLPVTVHVSSYEAVRVVAEAGADGIEHLAAVAEPMPADVAVALAKRGVDSGERRPASGPAKRGSGSQPSCYYTPTLAVFDGMASLPKSKEVTKDPWVRARVQPVVRENLEKGVGWWTIDRKGTERLSSGLRRFVEKGAPAQLAEIRKAGWTIVTGSDCGNPLTFHGPGVVRELELLRACGMTDAEVLRAATVDAARACRVEKETGTIEEGKVADLVMVAGNPLEDVGWVREVKVVVARGVAHRVEELLGAVGK